MDSRLSAIRGLQTTSPLWIQGILLNVFNKFSAGLILSQFVFELWHFYLVYVSTLLMTELGPALPQLVRVSFRLFVVLTSDDIVYEPDPLSPLIKKNPIIGINSLINVLDFMPRYAILYACIIFRCWIIVSIGVRIWLVCTNFFDVCVFSNFICVFFIRGFIIFHFANSKPSNSDFNFKLQLQTSIFGFGL